MKYRLEKYTKHYYTGNHLSSTQLVTDGTGEAVQQVEYAPFGEVVNEYNIDWNSGQVPDFKFNGKELDEENGMYYFEARYQRPPVFISRDPLFEIYPTFSPYAYCANSPLNLIDPSGMQAWHPDGEGNLEADKGDDMATLKTYLGAIYGGEGKISADEWNNMENQIENYKNASGNDDITGMKLTSDNGTFDNLVGKYLVTKQQENNEWGKTHFSSGNCSPTSFNRVDKAVEFVYQKDILGKLSMSNPIYSSWQGHSTGNYPAWGTEIIAHLMLGTIVDRQDILNGELSPGALIRMEDNSAAHSAIFIEYVRNQNLEIIGIRHWSQNGYLRTNFSDVISMQPTRGTNF
jgi:RHS repeat-associated protein